MISDRWVDPAPTYRGFSLRYDFDVVSLPGRIWFGSVIPVFLSRDRSEGLNTYRMMVADYDSPSYFVATAAVKLGCFKKEGVDVEFVAEYGAKHGPERLRDGYIHHGSKGSASSHRQAEADLRTGRSARRRMEFEAAGEAAERVQYQFKRAKMMSPGAANIEGPPANDFGAGRSPCSEFLSTARKFLKLQCYPPCLWKRSRLCNFDIPMLAMPELNETLSKKTKATCVLLAKRTVLFAGAYAAIAGGEFGLPRRSSLCHDQRTMFYMADIILGGRRCRIGS